MENLQNQNQKENKQQKKPQNGEKREVFPHVLNALKGSGNTSNKRQKHSTFGALDPKQAIARRANQARNGNNIIANALGRALQNRRNQVLENKRNREKTDPDNKKTKEEKEEEKVKKENGESDNKEDKDNKKEGEGKKKRSKPNLLNRDDEEEDDEESSGFSFFKRKKYKNPVTAAIKGFIRTQVIPLFLGVLVSILFLILLILIPVVAISSVVNAFSFDKEVSDAKADSDISDTDPSDSEESDDVDDTNKELISLIDSKYSSEDKTQLGRIVHAVEFVLLSYQGDKVYEDLTEDELDEVASIVVASKDGSGTYNLETLKTKLAQEFFPSKLPNYTTDDYEEMAQGVLDYLDEYQEIIGEDTTSDDTTSSGGMCTYNLTRVHYEGNKMITANINPSNIKVRLMQSTTCGGSYRQPLAGEELVDFEKYILGVAYAEMGDGHEEAAFKAQLIVARNFAFIDSLAKERNSLKQENGQWIMEITNCNADQYYCDPDKGCYLEDENRKDTHFLTGTLAGHKTFHSALPQNASERKWANEVVGKVYVDSENQLVWTNFADTETKKMSSLANQGLDYTSILLQMYPSGTKIINSTCTASADYMNWKQKDPAWSNVILGGGTNSANSIGNIGCLVTSIAMLIEKSGVLNMSPLPTMVSAATFNPGTFAQALNTINTFTSEGKLSNYSKVTQVVPKFVHQSIIYLNGLSQTDKLNKISSTLDQGLYCTAQVGGRSGPHFVAIDTVEGNTIKIFDPDSNATDMWQAYDYEETDKIVCFKVE